MTQEQLRCSVTLTVNRGHCSEDERRTARPAQRFFRYESTGSETWTGLATELRFGCDEQSSARLWEQP